MQKNRNTFAKRHRELEKKQKADQKRKRRAKKKQDADSQYEDNDSSLALSSEESAVLGVFRKHLMAPGQMFCFGRSDLESFDVAIAKLIDKDLLLQERFQGGYSLTDKGFAAMKNSD